MAIKTDPRPEPESNENHRAVRRLFEAAYGAGELHRLDEVAAAGYVGRWAGTDVIDVGASGLKARVAAFRAALGRLSVEVDSVEIRDGSFEAHWTARGRLERPLLGVEPECNVGEAGAEPGGPTVALRAVSRGTVTAGELLESATAWTLEGDGVSRGADLDHDDLATWTTATPQTGREAVTPSQP